jgi:hypothetical protein
MLASKRVDWGVLCLRNFTPKETLLVKEMSSEKGHNLVHKQIPGDYQGIACISSEENGSFSASDLRTSWIEHIGQYTEEGCQLQDYLYLSYILLIMSLMGTLSMCNIPLTLVYKYSVVISLRVVQKITWLCSVNVSVREVKYLIC